MEKLQAELDELWKDERPRVTQEVPDAAAQGGRVRLRVPYPTDATAPVHALGPYRVRLPDAEHRVAISEAEVRAGTVITVGDPGTSF